MVNYVNSDIQLLSSFDFPEDWVFPETTFGSRGSEQWYIDYPEILVLPEYVGTYDFNIQPGQTTFTPVQVFAYSGGGSFRPSPVPYSYGFIETGNYAVLNGEALPVYLVFMTQYMQSHTLNGTQTRYVDMVETYGLAYYLWNGEIGDSFKAYRLYSDYQPPSNSIAEGGGLIKFLSDMGEYLLNRSSVLFEVLNYRILGSTFWEILFGTGFLVYVGYVLIKFLVPV